MLKASLQLRLGQQLTMTPQLQQAIRLLQLPALELQAKIDAARARGEDPDVPPEHPKRLRYAVENFPDDIEWVLPTRLDNLIRAFEVYPRVVYGLDSIPAWPRLQAVHAVAGNIKCHLPGPWKLRVARLEYGLRLHVREVRRRAKGAGFDLAGCNHGDQLLGRGSDFLRRGSHARGCEVEDLCCRDQLLPGDLAIAVNHLVHSRSHVVSAKLLRQPASELRLAHFAQF